MTTQIAGVHNRLQRDNNDWRRIGIHDQQLIKTANYSEAAKECRRKKKEYVRCLESRVSILEQQNKQLILELKSLKDVYCRKEKTEQ